MKTKNSGKTRNRRTPEEIEMDRQLEADASFHLNLGFEFARDGENTLSYFFLAQRRPGKKKALQIIDQAEQQLKDALQCLRKARKHY